MSDIGQINSQQPERGQFNREIKPWLLRRFAEKVSPLPKWQSAPGRSEFDAVYQPPLLDSSQKGQRLAGLIKHHTGMTAMFSRDTRPVSIPRAVGSLIGRKSTIGATARYPMLNLWWFNPISGNQPETAVFPGRQSGELISQEFRSTLGPNHALPEMENGENRHIPGADPVPSASFRPPRLPPMTRPGIINRSKAQTGITDHHDPGTLTTAKPRIAAKIESGKSVARQFAAAGSPPGKRISPEFQNSSASDLTGAPEASGKRRIDNKQSIAGEVKQLSSQHSEVQLTPRQILPVPVHRVVMKSSSDPHHDAGQSPFYSPVNGKEITPDKTDGVVPPLLRTQAAVFTGSENPLYRKNLGNLSVISHSASPGFTPVPEEQRTWEAIKAAEKPTTTPSEARVKEANRDDTQRSEMVRVTPAMKPPSIARRILAAIPFVKNLARKTNRPAVPAPAMEQKQFTSDVDQVPAQIQTEASPREGIALSRQTSLSTTSADINVLGTKENRSESNANQVTQNDRIRNQYLTVDTRRIPDTGLADAHTSSLLRQKTTGQNPGEVYPASDLFLGKTPIIGPKITPLVPRSHETQRKVHLSPAATIPIAQQPTARLAMTKAILARSLDFPVANGQTQATPNNDISIERTLQAARGFTLPAKHKLDLTLLPANRLPAPPPSQINRSELSVPFIQRAGDPIQNEAALPAPATQASPSAISRVAAVKPPVEDIIENQPDIRALAREIYPLIRRMIIVERDRRPSR